MVYPTENGGPEELTMHVVQVPRRFVRSDWGGTETVILETSKSLLTLGHHTEIYCPRALSTQDHEVIDGVSVTRFGYVYPYAGLSQSARVQMDRKGGNLFSFPLMRALRRFPDLDLIHLHTGKRLGAIGRYVAARRKLPYVISLHGGVYDVPAGEAQTWTAPANGTFEWGKVLGWWVGARRVLDDAAAIICVGRKELQEAQRRHPNQTVVHLPNGVDARRFARGDSGDGGFRARRGIPARAFVILVVGRIDPQKNQLLAARLLAELRREQPGVHLVLVGPVTNADYDLSLSREISALGLDASVTLIRGLETSDPDLVNAYHAADLFLLPSVHEPFGIVILEAWASGLPVVASNVGGVPSFVSDGENGCLFPSGDLAALLAAVRGLIANPDHRRKIAAAGMTKAAEEFGWDRITRRLVGIYEEAIRANSLRK
jgi:glycosyltransferase involved in cell wall biosynthesis